MRRICPVLGLGMLACLLGQAPPAPAGRDRAPATGASTERPAPKPQTHHASADVRSGLCQFLGTEWR